jgi:hypothetical protein
MLQKQATFEVVTAPASAVVGRARILQSEEMINSVDETLPFAIITAENETINFRLIRVLTSSTQ